MKRIICIAVFVISVGCVPRRVVRTDHLTAESVYRTVLQQKFPKDAVLVVHPFSVIDAHHFVGREQWERRTRRVLQDGSSDLKEGVVNGFLRNNRRTRLIGAAKLAGPRVIARQGQSDGTFQTLGRQYPKALCVVSFSVPSFSTDGTQALVYCVRYVKPEDGEGRYYLLEFHEGAWKVVADIKSWAY